MSPVNPGPMWLTFDTPSGNFHSEFNELPAPAIHGPGSHTTFRSPTRVLAVGWRFLRLARTAGRLVRSGRPILGCSPRCRRSGHESLACPGTRWLMVRPTVPPERCG